MAKTPAAAASSSAKKTPAKSIAAGGGIVASSSKFKKTPRTKQAHPKKSPAEEVDAAITVSETTLYEDETRKFYSRIQFVPRGDKFMKSDPLSPPAFGDGETWRVAIGDLVCIENPPPKKSRSSSSSRDDTPAGKSSRKATASTQEPPFAVGWRPCQILSLFREKRRDKTTNKLSTKKRYRVGGPLRMEVRWFYRRADLDGRNRRYEESLSKEGGAKKKEEESRELFETGRVSVVDASSLLGRLALNCHTDDPLGHPVPTAVRPCHRYYLHEEQDIVEILHKKKNGMARTGLDCSQLLLQHGEGARKAAYGYLGLVPPKGDHDDDGAEEGTSLVTLPPPIKTISYAKGKSSAYYASCTLAHPWSQLSHADLLCPRSERGAFPPWQLCAGDVVALHCEESTPAADADVVVGRDQWYPYCVPWTHGQVTAIFKDVDASASKGGDSTSVVEASSLFCEVRWFQRLAEAQAECQKKKVLQFLKDISENTKRTSEVILEGKQVHTLSFDSLLGPVLIEEAKNSKNDPTRDDANLVLPTSFLIQNRRTVSDDVYCDEKGNPTMGRAMIDLDPSLRVDRGMDASKRFKKHDQDVILKAVLRGREERIVRMRERAPLRAAKVDAMVSTETLGTAGAGVGAAETVRGGSSPHKKRQLFGDSFYDEVAQSKKLRSSGNGGDSKNAQHNTTKEKQQMSAMEEDERIKAIVPDETRACCRSDPFHVDVSALKSFYKEVEILPQVDSYDKSFSCAGGANAEQGKGKWKVKIGDTVAVRVEQDIKDSPAVHFPFVVKWSPVEVISIHRVHKTKELCVKLRDRLSKKDQSEKDAIAMHDINVGKIVIEFRWLYRDHEIPGASKKKKESADSYELEELFETDHIDSCSADSILSPIRLHDATRLPKKFPTSIFGMPLMHYQCSRFWSIHRRSFVPSGPLSNRVSRGRMYSAYEVAFTKLQQRASASVGSTSVQHAEVGSPREKSSWKVAFQMAIQKLSLAEAARDTQENGMVLACREKERKQIKRFLQKGICGLNEGRDKEGKTKNLKTSLFIAGPPGTGKTASVRSIISELQKDQHEGLLPEFNFITLNGIELRHPFDSYVKFWEAVSGPRKERLPPVGAVHELEHYFCGDQEDVEEVDFSEKPVTVLMLDEIDYLVTPQQTLLYNFFDWPLRATTARLVVIGISNTINLPEKLTPRVQSRIGGDRCNFQAYNFQQTLTILKTRLGMMGGDPGYPVFEEDAIRFAARKCANLSGDIRKAFNMCKTAAETAFEDYSSGKRELKADSQPIVSISDIRKESKDLFSVIALKAISYSTAYEALLLISLGALMRSRESGNFEIKEILTKIESIANSSGEHTYMDARLSFADVLGMLNRLGDAGILQMKFVQSSPWPWISTHLHTYEIHAAFRDTNHSRLSEKHLGSQRLF